MRFSENRQIACIVLVLAVAASLVFGGGGALKEWRSEVVRQFEASGESISAELQEMRSNAATLVSIAREYEDANQAYIDEMDAALNALTDAESVHDKYQASIRLSDAVEDCYSDLSGLTLSDMDAQDARYKYKNFTSAQLRISHDGYNEQAAGFNQALSRFPASLLGGLIGLEPLGLFQ